MENQTATTSGENNKGMATPESQEAITGDKENQEKVATLQAELEQTKTQIKMYRDLQASADKKARLEKIERQKLERELRRIQVGEAPLMPEMNQEISVSNMEQKVLVKGAVADMILRNPEYQIVLDKDTTLKEVLLTNPLALVGEAYDTEDALAQIKEKLDIRVESYQESLKKTEALQKERVVKEFEVGMVNPMETQLPAKSSEEKPKGYPEDSIAKSIESKIRFT